MGTCASICPDKETQHQISIEVISYQYTEKKVFKFNKILLFKENVKSKNNAGLFCFVLVNLVNI